MKTKLSDKFYNHEAIDEIALRKYERFVKHYKTYVEHYKRRRLVPMPLNDFLKNYNI